MKHPLLATFVVLLASLVGTAARAETTVTEAWVRGTVAQQRATGFFARITSPTGGRLLSVSSPAAGIAEIHEMRMAGDVMRMRELPDGLPLPAGQTVELKPGGYHVMLMDLKRSLKAGDTVAVSLVFEAPDRSREIRVMAVPVRALGDTGATPRH
jgi:periplasmic copper chaperone A